MQLVGRKFSGSSSYRYGFNGQEKSTEIVPNESSYTAEFWQYDSRIGRRWNVDPIRKKKALTYVFQETLYITVMYWEMFELVHMIGLKRQMLMVPPLTNGMIMPKAQERHQQVTATLGQLINILQVIM